MSVLSPRCCLLIRDILTKLRRSSFTCNGIPMSVFRGPDVRSVVGNINRSIMNIFRRGNTSPAEGRDETTPCDTIEENLRVLEDAAGEEKSNRLKEQLKEVTQTVTMLEKQRDQMDKTLKKVKTEAEAQRNQLKGQLKEMEEEREEIKNRLQSVEKERGSDKSEELIREKENLSKALWKLDKKRKNTEGQMMNLNRLLEPIESQFTRMNKKDKHVGSRFRLFKLTRR
ncbi:pleckstrin homology domain-containing family D member 1-like [Centropristis striata]|uniref:pleckstrin homology domain-containing family D member 1-like n=1 Tax=Centropristis striata TaxID=184440 RepID=UPI0027DEFE19|nr:pleckstrin homology domain-containing family D member 1-like [Centropristis striata]